MGVYPAWQSSSIHLAEALKQGGRAMAGGVRQQRFRRILVGAQVAGSVALLSGASLLIASFIRLSHQETGFRPEGLWVGFMQLPAVQYPDPVARALFTDRFLSDLRSRPGIQAASISETVPLNGNGRSSYARADQEPPPPSQRPVSPLHNVSPGYFATLGIPLRSGRDFDKHDTPHRALVAVISESLAQRLYLGESPLGRPLFVGYNNGMGDRVEIVGIAGDVRTLQVAVANDAEIYRPWAQDNKASVAIAVRSAFATAEISRLVRAAVQKIDPSIAIFQPQPMQQIVDASLGQSHLVTWLVGVFAGVALLLTMVGIYGAGASTVVQRTGEIGVRMALGAQRRDILRLVLIQGMKPVIAGLAGGMALSFAGGHLLATQLYDVSPQNPWLLTATAFLLLFAGVLACAIPTARAISIDPVEALRAE
jgi:putative ABC transport system permease protein